MRQLPPAALMAVVTALIRGEGIAALAGILRFDPSSVETHHCFSLRHALLILCIVLALFMMSGVTVGAGSRR